MKNPLILQSEIEFLVIGPILRKDGIIIRSENLELKMIGFAHKIYRNEEIFLKSYYWEEKVRQASIGYIWGRLPGQGNKREGKLLFCWRIENNREDYRDTSVDENIKVEFKKFIENSYDVLIEFTSTTRVLTSVDFHERFNSTILWNIPTLLLQSRFNGSLLP